MPVLHPDERRFAIRRRTRYGGCRTLQADLQLTDWRPAAALIPGLLHFASDRPLFKPQGRIRRIRMFIPYVAQLRLARLIIKPIAPDTLDGAVTTQSSFRSMPVDPAQLLSGRPIHTARQEHPFWQIQFPEPIALRQVEIGNLLSRGAAEAYGLHVEFEDAEGRIWRWANSDPVQLHQRLRAFAANVKTFLDPAAESEAPAKDRLRAGRALSALIKAAEIAIDTGIAPEGAQSLRLEANRAVVRLVNRSTVDPRGTLLRAQPVVEALMERRARAKGEIKGHEFEAVALSLAATVLLNGATGRGRSAEDGEFLRKPSHVNRVERLANRYFLSAGGDHARTPLIFRKHGLMGPVLLQNIDGHLDAIEAVAGALRREGIESAICYGTLLGAVREKAFIPHDDDVDITFPFPTRPEQAMEGLAALTDRLTAGGFDTKLLQATLMIKVTDPATGICVDAFPIFDWDEDQVMMAMERIRLRAVPRASVLPFGRIDFYGRSFGAPARPEDFLADRYGKTWQTPIREFAGGTAVVTD